MKIFINWIAAIVILSFFACLTACSGSSSSNKGVSSTSAYPRVIERTAKSQRYFIMYSGLDTYRVTQAEVEANKQQFTVRLAKVDSLHLGILRKHAINGKIIQMYMLDSTSYTLDEPHTISMAKVARIER